MAAVGSGVVGSEVVGTEVVGSEVVGAGVVGGNDVNSGVVSQGPGTAVQHVWLQLAKNCPHRSFSTKYAHVSALNASVLPSQGSQRAPAIVVVGVLEVAGVVRGAWVVLQGTKSSAQHASSQNPRNWPHRPVSLIHPHVSSPYELTFPSQGLHKASTEHWGTSRIVSSMARLRCRTNSPQI